VSKTLPHRQKGQRKTWGREKGAKSQSEEGKGSKADKKSQEPAHKDQKKKKRGAVEKNHTRRTGVTAFSGKTAKQNSGSGQTLDTKLREHVTKKHEVGPTENELQKKKKPFKSKMLVCNIQG